MGERTDAVAKTAPTATEVNSLPVIVNLPFIQMGMLPGSGGATFLADHHRAGSVGEQVEEGFGSGKSCRKRRCVALMRKKYNGKSIFYEKIDATKRSRSDGPVTAWMPPAPGAGRLYPRALACVFLRAVLAVMATAAETANAIRSCRADRKHP
jgi:hypothetical protein